MRSGGGLEFGGVSWGFGWDEIYRFNYQVITRVEQNHRDPAQIWVNALKKTKKRQFWWANTRI